MRKLLIAILTLLLAVATIGTVAAFADSDANDWTATDASATTVEQVSGGTKITQNTLGTPSEVTYSQKMNLKTGANIAFTVSSFNVSADATEKMTFNFLNGSEQGIKLVANMVYADRATLNRKIRWDLYYVDKAFSGGIYYAESFYTYRWIFTDEHSVDVQYILGSYYVTVDDCTFVPKHNLDGYDFSDCTLSITACSTSGSLASYTVTDVGETPSSLIDGEWMDLGTSTLTYNDDGTMCYDNIDEEYSADESAEHLFLRNVVSNVAGYDVTTTLEIAIHYDTSATPGVWWGLAFAAKPFDNLTTKLFNEDGSILTALSTGDMVTNKGIMFQTTTGLAEPYYSNADAEKKGYSDNGGGKGYAGQEMLNTITVEIGTESSTIYWNGKVLFENYPMKQSDFPDGAVYPYFKFIETPNNKYKTNTITVKGINTPTVSLSGDSSVVKRLLSATEDLTLTVDARDNGDIVFAKSDRTLIDASLYSYDAASKTLTIKAGAFADVTQECSLTYLVGNDGGYQPVSFIFAEEFEALQAPVLSPASLTMLEGSATEDFTFTADLKNGTFSSLRGAGLTSSQYSYEIDGATNVITFVLSKDFLNNLSIGEKTLTLRTVSSDNTEEQSVAFVITVTDENGDAGDDNTSDGNGSNGGNSGNTTIKRGCGSSIAFSGVAGAAVLIAASAVFLKKRAK